MLELLRPSQVCPAVWEVEPAPLAAAGIKGLILDLDNTLVNWNSQQVRPQVAAWLEQARQAGLALCISSNAHSPRRVRRMAERLGVLCITGAGKPRASAFLRPAALMGTSPQSTAVIGDQLFTDILGGNRVGMYTVLVRPLGVWEFPGTMIVRLAERLLLALLIRTRTKE
jgi:hypothetical protein